MEGEQISIDYIKVEKDKCVNKNIKLSRRALETIVEMGIDYSQILTKESENPEAYKKIQYLYKAEEVLKISTSIAEQIGYCKKCKAKKPDDIGGDPMELGYKGYKD